MELPKCEGWVDRKIEMLLKKCWHEPKQNRKEDLFQIREGNGRETAAKDN